MISIDPNAIPVREVQALLTSAVAPRPIAFASTMDNQGAPNLSPFSFFNVFSSNPPILIFSPARRGTDNTTKHTLDNVLETKEVVINVVNHAIVQQMSLSSANFDKGVNEFKKAGLTMLASDTVAPYRVKESPIQMECKVNEVIPLGDKNGAGNLVICAVTRIHISESVLNLDGKIDPEKVDLVGRAGGSYYTRTKGAFFEIPKPFSVPGIGMDALPKSILDNDNFSNNELAILANVSKLPPKMEVENYMMEYFRTNKVVNYSDNELDLKAKELLSHGKAIEAWYFILSKTNK